MKKISPLFDRVYVVREQTEERTLGGLYIPEGSKEKGQTGRVVALGTGKIDSQGKPVSFQVKVGDVIFFGKYSGTDVDDASVILKEEDILGIVEQ